MLSEPWTRTGAARFYHTFVEGSGRGRAPSSGGISCVALYQVDGRSSPLDPI